jgi:hypothetical protein
MIDRFQACAWWMIAAPLCLPPFDIAPERVEYCVRIDLRNYTLQTHPPPCDATLNPVCVTYAYVRAPSSFGAHLSYILINIIKGDR